jgi:hypothetical protein
MVDDKRIKAIKDVLKVQLQPGNWDYDPYMHGMTNGMILCLSILEDKHPNFKEAPKEWKACSSNVVPAVLAVEPPENQD